MRSKPLILVADDNRENREILQTRLNANGFLTVFAEDGAKALEVALEQRPDLILLDVMMPKIDGHDVCRRLRADDSLPFIPIIMVTAKASPEDVVAGLEAGADEYLTKPVEKTALLARVKSMLRIKALHDTTQEQAAQLENWNRTLEERIREQRAEIERLNQLKRYFSPQLAEYIISSGDDSLIRSHRREIAVVFCDLKGFTAFAETAEPEEVMRVMHEYHDTAGPLIFRYEATLEHIVGDGLMAFFNDPVPCDEPAGQAIRMALAIRDEMIVVLEDWQHRGHDLGFGIGLAMGYATLGQIGFAGHFHYGAIGSVLNLASRLCDQAENEQVLLSQRMYAEIDHLAEAEPVGDLTLKGFHKPVNAFNVTRLKT